MSDLTVTWSDLEPSAEQVRGASRLAGCYHDAAALEQISAGYIHGLVRLLDGWAADRHAIGVTVAVASIRAHLQAFAARRAELEQAAGVDGGVRS